MQVSATSPSSTHISAAHLGELRRLCAAVASELQHLAEICVQANAAPFAKLLCFGYDRDRDAAPMLSRPFGAPTKTPADALPATAPSGERAATLAALKERFGPRYADGLALHEQHAHTTTWIPVQPPEAVIYPETTEE